MTNPRRDAILALVPSDRLVIDVGADHGYVASALGAIATERMPHRAGSATRRWVIADGLRPFRQVEVAVIAGMGARTIRRILEAGPRPDVLVAHAQDDPPLLRRYLASSGWRIEAERLAPEARGYAQVVRATAGTERATDLYLHFGPRLLEGDDPHLEAYVRREARRWLGIARAAESGPRHREAQERADFLHSIGQDRGWWTP